MYFCCNNSIFVVATTTKIMQKTETKGFGQKGTQINCYGPTRSALGETKSEKYEQTSH